MTNSTKQTRSFVWIACCSSFVATPAFAYIGPGAGVGAIGTFFAIIGTVLLLIVGFLWYPIKRIMKGKKPAEAAQDSEEPSDEL